MVKVTYPNGVVCEWDDTLTIGELVTAYEKGYHILTAIDHRGDNRTPVMRYVRVVTDAGERINSKKVMSCDSAFVRRLNTCDVLRLFEAEVNAAIKKRDNLLNFCPQ